MGRGRTLLFRWALWVYLGRGFLPLPGYAQEPVPQQLLSRTFREGVFQQMEQVGTDELSELPFYQAIALQVLPQRLNEVYVLDFDAAVVRLIQFNPPRIIRTFGLGKGQGPGELANPTDFKVDDSLHIWICDLANSRITIFAPDGSLKHTLPVQHPPLRIALQPEHFVVHSIPSINGQLYQYTRNGQFVQSFGKFSNDLSNAMAYMGWISSSKDGYVFFAGYWTGILAKFTPNGTRIFYRMNIDQTPPPRVKTDERGGRFVDRRAPVATYTFNVWGNYLYLHTIKDKTNILDVYDTQSGDYLFSYRLPDHLTLPFMTDTLLYGIYQDTLLTRWRWIPARP